MTLEDLKTKSEPEREKLYKDLCEEWFRLRLKKASGQLEKVHRLKEIKRDVARLKTFERSSATK